MSVSWLRWLRQRFDLAHDMASPADIIADIQEGMRFRGSNLWVLIFAILVASVGLNVNSTAVIIGAMLISPLMGPIVGVGYGAATMNLELIRRGLKNLAVAAFISLLVSTIYFWLTPLSEAGSELLARTQPTTWDVLIALFGGAAGAVGLTRRERGNVVPGVAIATALMPPLCTAGYGLATAHWSYLLGALYLFCLNCVFISLATFLVTRVLPVPVFAYGSRRRARRVQLIIWGIALLSAIPSVYLAARIVQRTVFTQNAQRFVEEQLNLPGTYVVTRRIEASSRSINVLLAGQRLTRAQLEAANLALSRYRLPSTQLIVRQGMAQLDSADTQAMRNSLLEDLRSRNEQTLAGYDARLTQLQEVLRQAEALAPASLPPAPQLLAEVQAEHPTVRQLGLSRLVQPAADSLLADTTLIVAVRTLRPLPRGEEQRLRQWLQARTGGKRPVRLLVQGIRRP